MTIRSSLNFSRAGSSAIGMSTIDGNIGISSTSRAIKFLMRFKSGHETMRAAFAHAGNRMDLQVRAGAVRVEIERAFSAPSYPGDEGLTVDPSLEGRDIAAAFKGRHWRDVPAIEWHSGVL